MMNPFLLAGVASEPAVVAGLVSVLVAILTPYVSQKLREHTQGRMEAASVAVRRMDGADRFYDALQARLEATEAENDDLTEKLLRLERVVMAWDTRFMAISDDLNRVCAALEADPPETAVVLKMAVQALDRIRRREFADEEHAG